MTKYCPVCGKKLGIWKTGLLWRYKGQRFCSIACKKQYKAKENMSTEVENVSN